ncbi:hypothetical protein [Alkalibacillus almallahensis]|uniref:hypothetical protein n=1 Tax=Alkalibacillus almallahensis TaxID=1379154 RepID=UPI001422E890|nr:hypothetical protein [Alkalibacillus almallahensis]NIK11697.1 putative membrane protein [Alkalibacillus almallahensis]
MQEKANFWSFIFSVICILLFLTASFSGWISDSVVGIHPLTTVLGITLCTFLLGIFGLSGVRNLMGLARSVSTVVITLSLLVFLGVILLSVSLIN